MTLFLLLLAAHICGDFFLYSPRISSAKREASFIKRLKAVFMHCFFHFILVILWLMPYSLIIQIQAALFVTVFHFVIDISRVYIEDLFFDKQDFIIMKRKDAISCILGNKNADSAPFMKKYLKRWICINLIDQGLHLAVIIMFLQLI